MASTVSDPHLLSEAFKDEVPNAFDLENGQPLLLLPHGKVYAAVQNIPLQKANDFPDFKKIGRKPLYDHKHVYLQPTQSVGWPDKYRPRTFGFETHPTSPCRRVHNLLSVGVIVLLFFGAFWVVSMNGSIRRHPLAPNQPSGEEKRPLSPSDIQNPWAAYTPYFPVEIYTLPPSNCRITQVNIIQRHGARFPTSGATNEITTALANLQSATQFLDPRLNFLHNYTYTLGQDDLIPFGAFQSEEAGKEALSRYPHLISQENLPFVRSSSGQRVVDSATNWTAGISLASDHVFNPVLSVVLDEKQNDTLADHMCPNAGSSDPQTEIWTSIYGAPIAARLNAQAPGATLSPVDISNLIPLCAFETLARQTPSPFCALFSAAEFAQYEYLADLDKFYKTGYGQALGPVQGVGYINELLARLTETSVRDNTQTNRTLDASPITFPLNRTLYADFSHDNQMIAIYAAMGLFKQPAPLDPTRPDPKRTWITSHLTPFSGRMVTERLSCTPPQGINRSRYSPTSQTFIRILVNDALQPLEFCGGDQEGLCTLNAFIKSQTYARNDGEGDFDRCFL